MILGFTTIFDRDSKRIGFAESTCQCKSCALSSGVWCVDTHYVTVNRSGSY